MQYLVSTVIKASDLASKSSRVRVVRYIVKAMH